jgi:hypothetical protein
MTPQKTPAPQDRSLPRRPWQTPRVEELPRLTELTLETSGAAIPGDCDIGGGGSTCF